MDPFLGIMLAQGLLGAASSMDRSRREEDAYNKNEEMRKRMLPFSGYLNDQGASLRSVGAKPANSMWSALEGGMGGAEAAKGWAPMFADESKYASNIMQKNSPNEQGLLQIIKLLSAKT